jgi:hypothetical protein
MNLLALKGEVSRFHRQCVVIAVEQIPRTPSFNRPKGRGIKPQEIKNRQSFPNDESALKLIFMGLQHISLKWTMPIRDWGIALNQFALVYGARVPHR